MNDDIKRARGTKIPVDEPMKCLGIGKTRHYKLKSQNTWPFVGISIMIEKTQDGMDMNEFEGTVFGDGWMRCLGKGKNRYHT